MTTGTRNFASYLACFATWDEALEDLRKRTRSQSVLRFVLGLREKYDSPKHIGVGPDINTAYHASRGVIPMLTESFAKFLRTFKTWADVFDALRKHAPDSAGAHHLCRQLSMMFDRPADIDVKIWKQRRWEKLTAKVIPFPQEKRVAGARARVQG